MHIKGQIVEYIRKIRASYWFIPGAMLVTAILLSQFSIEFDEAMGTKWLGSWDFLYANKPEGARTLLSTIAGSMIGVAGVTFSITIAAVAYASSQFGPRIIDNFMRDQGNQITLGTFISTFIYCLLVLRVVRDGSEGPGFVPHGSVFIGVVLAVASLAVLIYFIHHTPESIHVSKLVAKIGHQLLERTEQVYPHKLGSESEVLPPELGIELGGDPVEVRSTESGHIQSLDIDALLELAQERSILINLLTEPGEFVSEGQLLAQFQGEINSDDARQLRSCFVIGDERSPTQDLFYLSDQLIDIAGRALSPGINDPQTAMLCVAWLSAALAKLGQKSFPSRYRTTQDGSPMLVTKTRDFETYVNSFYDQLRPYVERDRNAALYTLERSVKTIEILPPRHRNQLYKATIRLLEGCIEHLQHPRDSELLAEIRKSLTEVNSSQARLKKTASTIPEDAPSRDL